MLPALHVRLAIARDQLVAFPAFAVAGGELAAGEGGETHECEHLEIFEIN